METIYTSNINGMKSALIFADRMDLVPGAILIYIKKEHRANTTTIITMFLKREFANSRIL